MNGEEPKERYILEAATSRGDAPGGEWPWVSIFNTAKFFKLHTKQRQGFYFQYVEAVSRKIMAVAHFAELEPGDFVSPVRGTFGGVETINSDLSMQEEFIGAVETYLQQAGARSVSMLLKPFCHDPSGVSNLYNILCRRGYSVTSYDLTYALDVTVGDLIEIMQRNNQKRVRKCQREGYMFKICAAPEECRTAYEVIAANRAGKGIPMTMTYEQLQAMQEAFPDRVHFFNVTAVGKVIAASVCLAVNQRVFYVFYWGDLPGFETFSPVVLLAQGIHHFAREHGFAILDAGISTANNLPNGGLIRFKENLGFKPSLKLGFQKRLGNG